MEQTVTAVIVAAGSSTRMGFDKLAYCWQGKSVLRRSVEAFTAHPMIQEIVVVTGADDTTARAAVQGCPKPCTLVRGGNTRAQSVWNGVQAAHGQMVAIHDGARPFVSTRIITDALEKAAEMGAAAPAVPVKDTIKTVDQQNYITGTPPRSTLYAIQTPQCFDKALYLQAAQAAQDQEATDDCQLVEQMGHPVALTPGSYENYKITTKEDLKEEKPMRIGHGYDVHKLVEGRPLILGGVEISYEKGLLGHSDADVLAHAISDALLGAAALGDIGKHFPDTDPAYKGADSLMLLSRVTELLREKGYQVENVDSTILCQAPKLAAHIQAMRQNLANAMALPLDSVSVKATTEEHLGFTGEGLGIAAYAVTLIR